MMYSLIGPALFLVALAACSQQGLQDASPTVPPEPVVTDFSCSASGSNFFVVDGLRVPYYASCFLTMRNYETDIAFVTCEPKAAFAHEAYYMLLRPDDYIWDEFLKAWHCY